MGSKARPVLLGLMILPFLFLSMTSGLPPGAFGTQLQQQNHLDNHQDTVHPQPHNSNKSIQPLIIVPELTQSNSFNSPNGTSKETFSSSTSSSPLISLSETGENNQDQRNNEIIGVNPIVSDVVVGYSVTVRNKNDTNKDFKGKINPKSENYESSSQSPRSPSLASESHLNAGDDGGGSTMKDEKSTTKDLNLSLSSSSRPKPTSTPEFKPSITEEESVHNEDKAEETQEVEHPRMEPLQNSNNRTGNKLLRESCNKTEQCKGDYTECRVGICKCALGFLPRVDNGELCGEASAHHVEVPTADPTMIGVVIGLILMSVTLCVVLRLFAKARFRENRTIFNTPNPRLMNVSLLKGSKTLLRGNSAGGQRSRRGSNVSTASGQVVEGDANNSNQASGGGGGGSGSGHPHSERLRPYHKQLSTDTNTESNHSSRPISKSKIRQDSVASNV